MSKTSGKIIGGFLAGAGVITYLLHTDAGRKIKGELQSQTKQLASEAEVKLEGIKEETQGLADQIVNFAVENKHTIMDAANYLINTFIKKK